MKPRRLGVPPEAGEVIASYSDDTTFKGHVDCRAAKSGDTEAAIRLVQAIVKPTAVEAARERFGQNVAYVPVLAQEATGRNKIPVVLAAYYAQSTGATLTRDVVQTNTAFHTGARPLERLIAPARFAGPVEAGQRYVLVDDVTVMGGTLADMANHIRSPGGEVVGVVTLVNASRMGLQPAHNFQVRKLEERYGEEIRSQLGVEPAALTAGEAGYLLGYRDADALRAGIAKARDERGRRLRAKGIRPSEAEDGGVGPPKVRLESRN